MAITPDNTASHSPVKALRRGTWLAALLTASLALAEPAPTPLPADATPQNAAASGPAAAAAPAGAHPHTIVFIHGMFMTPAAWDNWQSYFQQLGYTTLAPAWPLHGGGGGAAAGGGRAGAGGADAG